MAQPDTIQAILKDTDYDFSLFKEKEIDNLRDRIFVKPARGKERPFVNCIVRDKDIREYSQKDR